MQVPWDICGECVDPTGPHFQQPVPPVGPGHTEVVDRASQDVEGLSLQSELGRVGPQTLCAAHSLHCCWMSGGETK